MWQAAAHRYASTLCERRWWWAWPLLDAGARLPACAACRRYPESSVTEVGVKELEKVMRTDDEGDRPQPNIDMDFF